jgi:hypothetical protein
VEVYPSALALGYPSNRCSGAGGAAEAAGFEPARGVIPNPLSRRAH